MARPGRGKQGGGSPNGPDPDRYLAKRDGWFHYKRRVPEHAKTVDQREFARKSLKTRSRDIARIRRDAFEAADNLFWSGLTAGDDVAGTRLRYEAAQKRALTLGIIYRTADEIARDAPDEELLSRVLTAAVGQDRGTRDALIGAAERPNPTASEAMDIYVNEIAVQDIANYSEAQRRSWEKVKRRASKNFVREIGDRPILSISREEAQRFWQFWQGRVEKQGLDPDTARRDFGNMRTLFRDYARWSQVDAVNPFDGLSFKRSRVKKERRPPYSIEWLKGRILAPGALETLNDDARLILFTLIETGCRPWEICNIAPEHIRLDDPVPHLRIRHMAKRAVKTDPSERGGAPPVRRLAPIVYETELVTCFAMGTITRAGVSRRIDTASA